jgi:Domain of unknown function (DUF397)
MWLFDVQRRGQFAWRVSSFCSGGECAQVIRKGDRILLRSSTAPRAVVKYTPEEFRALQLGIKAGEFDDLAQIAQVVDNGS